MERFGDQAWTVDDPFVQDHWQSADSGELIGGFAGRKMTCTMRLQQTDLVHWPQDATGDALYLHKLAVRRAAAGQDWPAELVQFARDRAIEAGVATIRLDTLGRLPLIELYGRLGFKIVGNSPSVPELILMQLIV